MEDSGIENGVLPNKEFADGDAPVANPGDMSGSFIKVDDLFRFCKFGDGVTAG